MRPIVMVPIGFVLLALLFVVLAIDALRRRRAASGVLQLVVGVLFLACAALGGVIAVGTAGYTAFTREVVAATATVEPQDDGSHLVDVLLADGTQNTFVILGDELYVDAQILKWHPAANMVGLHTGYTLDRIAGRYRELEDEQGRPRTIYRLSSEPPVDLFDIVRRWPFLSGLVDATYGSGTFVPLGDRSVYEIRVSTSGLLVRTAD